MERLTRKSLGYKDEWIADGKLSNIEGVVRGQAIDKLAEFENFMEEFGFESLNDLQNALGTIVFSDGYDVNGKEVHGQQFILHKDLYQGEIKQRKKVCEWRDKKILELTNENLTLKHDRDTWKKACELAVETLQIMDGCTYWRHNDANYFYQQAQKKE